MKYLIITLALAVSGCGATHQLDYDDPHRYGYKDYDPCFRCGEDWIFLNIDYTSPQHK